MSTAWIVTTCSWTTAAAALASRANRRRAAPVAAIPGVRSLIATSRSRARSRARNTMPIPPRPIRRRTSYGPELAQVSRLVGGLEQAHGDVLIVRRHRLEAPSTTSPVGGHGGSSRSSARSSQRPLRAASRSRAPRQSGQESRWATSSVCSISGRSSPSRRSSRSVTGAGRHVSLREKRETQERSRTPMQADAMTSSIVFRVTDAHPLRSDRSPACSRAMTRLRAT